MRPSTGPLIHGWGRACRRYPKLLGLDRSKEVAQELVDEAKDALKEYGDAAAPLNGLADYIIARSN